MKWFLIIAYSLTIMSCSHVIDTTPDVGKLNYRKDRVINKKVTYYISSIDLEKEVKDPTTGGDGVKYFPYKELESGLKKVLYNVFDNAERLSQIPEANELKNNKIHYIFIPIVETKASSDSNWTWPPTHFDLSFSVKALDTNGQTVWSKTYKTVGRASSDEWKRNFGYAAKIAAEKVFQDFTDDLQSDEIFRK